MIELAHLIRKLAEDEDPIVSNAAKRLAQLHQHTINGELSQSEYKELAEDVIDLKHISNEKNKLHTRIVVVNTLTKIKDILAKLG